MPKFLMSVMAAVLLSACTAQGTGGTMSCCNNCACCQEQCKCCGGDMKPGQMCPMKMKGAKMGKMKMAK